MGRGFQGVVASYFHFSFADYYNPENIQFGKLRVINDDQVKPGTGFDLHPHSNMEIISYVVEGELTHRDSMGNGRTLKRGEAQYMSAGTGVFHSEHNRGRQPLRFLQIWILPDAKGHVPQYGDVPLKWEDRIDKWLAVATGPKAGSAPITLHQDMHVFVTCISPGRRQEFAIKRSRQAYFVLIEGRVKANGQSMVERDGLEAVEQTVTFEAGDELAHIIALEMGKGER
jgi:redox-sensitive bicupin YhaK (pirin superfamily)